MMGSTSPSPSQSRWPLFILCIFMHLFLMGLHLTLLILGFKLQDHSFTVPDSRLNVVTGTLFDYVTLSPNVIVKVSNLSFIVSTRVTQNNTPLDLPHPATVPYTEACAAKGSAPQAEPHGNA